MADPQVSNTEASRLLDRIESGRCALKDYNTRCDEIDRIYADKNDLTRAYADIAMSDKAYALFWASMEVLKPAIYSRTPNVVVKARFSDASPADKVGAELLERVINSEFERASLHDEMLLVRDDLALLNRGVLWIDQDDDGAIQPCWIDREDFVHDPARSWRENEIVARREWWSHEDALAEWGEVADRLFYCDPSKAGFTERTGGYSSYTEGVPEKAAVWRVWDKVEGRVYVVAEGIEDFLSDEEAPFETAGFFPCPKPAYGTIVRRTLIPSPDYNRFAVHLSQINDLTRRIYELLDQVKMRGFVAGGGEVGQAIETAMGIHDSAQVLIPVSGAALTGTGGIANAISWMPLDMVANTITGLIEARAQLFADFDRLSGISDIMRGETEAAETLGAQRIKTQYGSVRVKERQHEMERLARDAARIAADIIAENFSDEELLDIAQMDIPTQKQVDKSIKELEKAAKAELEKAYTAAMESAQPDPTTGEVPPEAQQAAMQQYKQAEEQIHAQFSPQFAQLRDAVVLEDVMDMIRDRRARSLVIDVETDSTVMTDETADRMAHAEWLNSFAQAVSVVTPLMGAGEDGAKLAGAILRSSMDSTRMSRDLDAALEQFINNAPKIAAAMGEQQEEDGGLAEANKALAEAEMEKARAANMKVQADAQLKQAELQGKMQQMQLDASEKEAKFMLENGKLQLAVTKQEQEFAARMAEVEAKTNLMQAQTAKLLSDIGLDVQRQNLEEYKAAEQSEQRQVDNQRAMMGDASAERPQAFGEQQAQQEPRP